MLTKKRQRCNNHYTICKNQTEAENKINSKTKQNSYHFSSQGQSNFFSKVAHISSLSLQHMKENLSILGCGFSHSPPKLEGLGE